MKSTNWLVWAGSSMLLWGVWGAFAGAPAERGFPETLIYVVWALTMIPPALYVLARNGWRLQRDRRSLWLGAAAGILGAGGQMVLFHAVKVGPTYLVFPIVSLSPVITIALSYFLLKERVGKLGMAGIVLAACALPLFDFSSDGGGAGIGWWFVLALGILVAWGLQSYFIRLANETMDAESIFFYMMLWGLAFIPVALAMTDFSKPINYGLTGPWLAAVTQVLNAAGALMLVYAFRYGKAIVVSPMVNAGAPLLTAIISLLAAGTMPSNTKLAGIVLALVAALLLALPDSSAPDAAADAP
ncbi:putative membrane protein [Pseudoduganella lurida]|uniref:Putative membrane protein n=1 Tax=Pseudoduganella lurida TaxID=1036180 RepID=A0A562RE19_9BURK|nr:DMT family transporter [Pseudoduganella lurida]TWI67278.1 putative membrane protein [Pseudoduganella lurida]